MRAVRAFSRLQADPALLIHCLGIHAVTGTRRGLVIVGEVEMGDSEIESAAADRAFRFRRLLPPQRKAPRLRRNRQFNRVNPSALQFSLPTPW
jgi:hypothetical protein